MSLPSKDDWILKVFTEPLTSSGAKPRTSCPKIFILRCRFLAMGVGIRRSIAGQTLTRITRACYPLSSSAQALRSVESFCDDLTQGHA